MMHFSRPYRRTFVNLGAAGLLVAGVALSPLAARAQFGRIAQIIEEPIPLLHSSSPGYLGVMVGDVDSESAPKLKLKEVRGAVITLIDHDAPAAQAGLRVNDVVLEVNGQAVEGAEQFSRMMHEIPAGHNVSLVISRDGNIQTVGVQVVDHRKMEHDVWNKLGSSSDDLTPVSGMGILAGGGDAPLTGGFHMPFFGSSLNVGALVEPLTSQMADYLGVQSGLMIKQVARKSEAAAAGLKAFDVILKVGPDGIATVSDWDRALRSNQGKPVQVTILRDKKQQTITLQVDSKRKGEVDFDQIFSVGDCPLVAEVDPEFVQQFAGEAEAAAQAMRDQAEALQNQMGSKPLISPEQAEEIRRQAEKLRDTLKSQGFQIDQKQIDEMKEQMEEFQKNFNPQDFKIDPQQMQQFRQQMDQFKQQLQEMQVPEFGHFV
jgi:C-terminal processing protease CtpA/Prc